MRGSELFRQWVGFLCAFLFEPWRDARLIWLVVGTFFLISAYLHAVVMAPGTDVAWLLVAADRLIAGGTYLEDFYEPNAPLAILIYCPGVYVARLLGLNPYMGFLITVYLSIGASIYVVRSMSRRLFSDRALQSGVLTVACAACLLIAPRTVFGQREHIAMVLFLPFIVAIAARDAGRHRNPRSVEIGISAAAAVGSFIKPYLVLMPIALFLVALLRKRSLRVVLRSDFQTFFLAGIVYIFVIVLFFPGWLAVAKVASQLYGAHDGEWTTILPSAISGIVLSGIILIASRFVALLPTDAALSRAFAAAAIGALIAVVIQNKGWGYHYYPARVALFVLLAMFLAAFAAKFDPSPMLPRVRRQGFRGLPVSIAVLVIAYWHLSGGHHTLDRYHHAPLTQMVRTTKPGASIFIFSNYIGDGFPLVILEKRAWASRFPFLWPLPGLVHQLSTARTTPRREHLLSLRRHTIKMTVADFQRYHPDVVIVRVDLSSFGFKEPFDFLSFYRTDPAFEEIWRRYRLAGRISNYELYVRSE